MPDIPKLESLRSLGFRMGVGHMIRDYFAVSIKALSNLPPLVSTLTYEFTSVNSLDGDLPPIQVDWARLETLLLGLPHPSLSLCIRLSPRVDHKVGIVLQEDSVRSEMPELSRRGLLTFQVLEDA